MGTLQPRIRVLSRAGVLVLLLAVLLGETPQAAMSDKQVSLDVNRSTLGAALKSLSRQTAYRFDLDPKWAQQPVTLKVQNISLQECLQRLLKGFNYAIVIKGDGHIALTIFGEKTALRSAPAVRAPQPRPLPATPPPPPAMVADDPAEEDEEEEEEEGEGEGEPDLEEPPGDEDTGENDADEPDSERDSDDTEDGQSEIQEEDQPPDEDNPGTE